MGWLGNGEAAGDRGAGQKWSRGPKKLEPVENPETPQIMQMKMFFFCQWWVPGCWLGEPLGGGSKALVQAQAVGRLQHSALRRLHIV